ncbi:MAG: type II toxin-antitoxin system VapB family antitoxin [Alphaproteobacteria bacterium]|nr:type II toxin-antitoxin system VapB family antitoxin [Alphaproteobacteria bacterium]
MGLNIKNEDVEARVRRLAAVTGLGVTEAIDSAVREKLARLDAEREARAAQRSAALDALLDQFGPLEPLDLKAIDEEMYGPDGVPR